MRTKLHHLLPTLLLLLVSDYGASGQGTAFTYQGKLASAGNPATGLYDFSFALYDAATNGSQKGAILALPAVGVASGLFTVTLDFGAQFDGTPRWLDVSVKTNGVPFHTRLTPRQPVTPAPYALYTLNAASAAVASTVAPGAVGTAALAPGSVGSSALAPASVTAATLASSAVQSTNVNASSFNTTFWKTDGNTGTTPGAQFLGTLDNQALELKVNGARALRLEPNTNGSPNLAAGCANNYIANGVRGASILGGGDLTGWANSVLAGGDFSVVGGGRANLASGLTSTIGGGAQNGTAGQYAFVGGGFSNHADGDYAAVPGGSDNWAVAAYSLAAGQRAKANHLGAFVWADAQPADFASTAANQFLVRAQGGVGINTNNPQSALHVAGTITALGFAGSGAGLTGIPSSALPTGLLTNNQTGVSLNGTFNAASGLVIENRTSDPPSPAVGQIWLRTDL